VDREGHVACHDLASARHARQGEQMAATIRLAIRRITRLRALARNRTAPAL
jgi:hypothetical protein